MRPVWILGLLLVVPARAQDESERVALARVAMEAQIRIGDLLHEKGDYKGALEAYQRALAIYERSVQAAEGVPPERVVAEKEIVEKPADTEDVRPAGARAGSAEAVDLALAWLARHQDQDGRWDSDDYMKHDPPGDKCGGTGGALHDVGLTGLATLAFLGAGFTHLGDAQQNPHAGTVTRALGYLVSVQGKDGVLGTRATHSFMYNHAIGTLALCEALAETRDPRLKEPARQAVDFIQTARNPYLAWRYEPRGGENDTSVTAWCVAALASARHAGLDVDPGNFTGALAWFEKVTDPTFGQAGYTYPGGSCARLEGMQDRFPADQSQAMTAAAIVGRILCGEDPARSEMIRKGADLCLIRVPAWNRDAGSIDMYYWYWGTLAMFHVGGTHWRKWSSAIEGAIVKHQNPRDAGARAGSWDPIDAWSSAGGRIYSTAMMTLCLEVYYRYERVAGVR